MLSNPQLQEMLVDFVKAERWDAVRALFKVYDDDTPDEIADKVILFGHFFLPHYFRQPSPDFHREIIKRFFSPNNEYTGAPRGFSKTTMLQTCSIFSIVNRLDKFIVILEKTFFESAEVIKGIKDEFVDNYKILQIYGQLISETDKFMEKSFISDSNLFKKIKEREAMGDVFINGVRLRGKGFNTTIRGLKTRQWRPTRIILDDVEEDDHIDNPEQRQKYLNNYQKGIIPAVDIDGSIKVFGTILHQDSLLNNLINAHNGLIYRAHEGNDPVTAPEESFLWPERWSREALVKKLNDMRTQGQSTSAYVQEYLNDPIAEEDRTFKFEYLWEMIKRPDKKGKYRVPVHRISVDEFEKKRKAIPMNGFAMIDAGDSITTNADWTGVVVIFVDPNGNRYRVDVRREKRNIKGLIDLIFEIWGTWAPKGLLKIGLEKKAMEDQVMPLFKDEKDKRQKYPVLEELKPMQRSKENRIKGALEGFYETGKFISVYTEANGFIVPVGHTDQLLEELYNFPSSKHDDLSDAEAYSADLIVIPNADEKQKTLHHTPQDDPFEEDIDPLANVNAGYNDPDPF